jgi:ATP-dependent helicase Lhr and Lhr-like helicase
MPDDPLDSFSPPVAAWFRRSFGRPTPPQAAGWPAIQAGEHTLILAPTGSGKTLAAFLWGIDRIYREFDQAEPGVRLLYVSPLKALNNDIERNLRAPLEGIRATAARLGQELPRLRVAVRTGDTPGPARAQMVKRPPHILITTPESLYLILTSARARHMLRTVHTVIVDEIHTLCGNKRGVHLSLTLERLERLVTEEARRRGEGVPPRHHPSLPPRLRASAYVQRIGLSATQRPLEEVARFLGGQEWQPARAETGDSPDAGAQAEAPALTQRPVTIVDTGYRKPLDLKVVTVVEDFGSLPGNTIWPAVVARLLGDIRRHRSTLVFTNNRRLAERTSDRLNAQLAAEETEEIPPGSTEALAPGGVVRDRGMFALGASGPIRAHHGSMSKEARRQMEEDLKAGRLPALVGTSSLELGIDIGSVDFVAQLQSPKSVAQGLQRVGRSGHLVGQTSTGRIYATFREDLVEAAAIAHGMLEGAIEETYTPQNPLDVLAQQIVAMVAVEDWSVPALYDLVRQAYPYHELSRRAFDSVLDMLSGKYYTGLGGEETATTEIQAPARQLRPLAALRPRIVWDRVNDRLAPLPGSRLLAVSNAGTIPDTGAYAIYLADGRTRVGELDEEFVFETRPGDAFLFGSQVWRVMEIKDDRLIVAPAPGAVPRMPFWNGDYPWRPYELGQRIGRFRREIVERLRESEPTTPAPDGDGENLDPALRGPAPEVKEWLAGEYGLDHNSIQNLVAHVQGQVGALGLMSSDRTIVAEYFRDAVGELRLVLHSPFGGRVNGAWAIALRSALRDRLGTEPELMANDDGILFRFPQLAGPPPLDLLRRMSPAEARERILAELPNSALFGAQFRMAAGRALLLPRAHGQRRTPFWLQRLKAKDLLALVRRFGDFPIVAEAYRACLNDVMDLTHLEAVLAGIQSGSIQVVPVETAVPSPIANDLLFYFMNQYVYEWDAPKAERDLQKLALQREVLADILAERQDLSDLLSPSVVAAVVAELQHCAPGYQARTVEELAVQLEELGDRSEAEVAAMCLAPAPAATEASGRPDSGVTTAEDHVRNPQAAEWLAQLAAASRVVTYAIPTANGVETRWLPVDFEAQYRVAFAARGQGPDVSGADPILRRYLAASGPVTRAAILQRYAFDPAWLDTTLATLVSGKALAQGRFTPGGEEPEYCDLNTLEQIQRRTLAELRRAVQPVSLPAYAAFLVRWQHLAPSEQLQGVEGLRQALGQLRGLALPGELWDGAVLPARVADYSRADLAALCAGGELVWTGSGGDARHLRVRYFFRGDGALFLGPPNPGGLSPEARTVYDYLKGEGASFLADLQAGLGLRRDMLSAALTELAIAGLATNDNLSALQAILAAGAPTPVAEGGAGARVEGSERQPFSALEADLAARLAGKPRPLTHTRYHAARRDIRRRMAVDPSKFAGAPGGSASAGPADMPGRRTPAPDLAAGRWSLVHRAGVMGPAQRPEERAARQAEVLLARYGLVSRDLLIHEDAPYDWGLLYAHLQRLEMRGEVRRGYFVAGLAGAQFALPEAVEGLRAAMQETGDELVILNAADPANIYAGEVPSGAPGDEPGDDKAVLEQGSELTAEIRFARVPSTSLVLWRGRPALIAQDNGARLSAPADLPPAVIARALTAYLARPGAPRHLLVGQWNGAPVWSSPGAALLKAQGFYRSPAGMEWWAPA